MFDPTIQLKRLSSTSTDSDTLRIIVFNLSIKPSSVEADQDSEITPQSNDGVISEYLFALPITAVLKAITCPPVKWVVDSGIGMADVDSQNVTVLDLRHHFLNSNPKRQETSISDQVVNSDQFLILLKTRTDELCGIPVAHPPVLTDIPLSAIRPVPLSYRQAAGLSLASHMAILSETEGKKPVKVFLLGMNKIIEKNCVGNLTANVR